MTRWLDEFISYKKLLIRWDEDKDERIFLFVDKYLNNLPAPLLNNIVWLGEREASITIITKPHFSAIIHSYLREEFFNVDGDSWDLYVEEEDEGEYNDVERKITTQQRYEVCKRQQWKCNFCYEKLKWNKNSPFEGEVAHIDHIHPYTQRFTYINGIMNISESSNLQALCPSCNFSKSKKMIN